MNFDELRKRFIDAEYKPSNPTVKQDDILIYSRDSVAAVLTPMEEDRYFSLGKYRLKERLNKDKNIRFTGEMYLNAHLLYRMMRILRRKNHIEIGFYFLRKGYVFAVRNREACILIAPRIQGTEEDRSQVVSIESLVCNFHRNILAKFEEWNIIVNGRNNKAET